MEWLLLVAAMVGVGATSALVVERVVSTSSEVPADIEVLAIDAEIEAAAIEERANRDFTTDPDAYLAYSNKQIKRRYKGPCQNVASDYSAVIRRAKWKNPEEAVEAVDADPTAVPPVLAVPAVPAVPAKCKLTRVGGLASGG